MPQTPPTCRPSKVAQPVTPSPPSTATAPRGAMSQQGSHSKVYRAGTNEKTPASRDIQPSIIPRLFSPGQESDRGGRTAALHEERSEGGGASGSTQDSTGAPGAPALLEPLPPLTRPSLQAHSTRTDLCRWRTHTALPCVITVGAVSNRLSSKMGQTLAGRRDDTSEKWALIACTAGQACPMSTGSHSIATPSPPPAGEAEFQAGSGDHGPGDSQAPGDCKK